MSASEGAWFRGHKVRHGPLYFNRDSAGGRFNAPAGEFGVLYVGADDLRAFVEAFCHDERLRTVAEDVLRVSCLCPVGPTRPVRLVDLTTGSNLRRLGGDSRICNGPWTISRCWALALWGHPEAPDGLLYRSRIAPELHVIALFDRADDAVSANCAGNVLVKEQRLAEMLDYHAIALI